MKKRSLLSRVGRWAAELILVFVGVYAAFWLNDYQQHRQDAERRDRILASIEQTLREGIESNKVSRAKQQQQAAEFRRALDAREMPALRPFVFTTDYNPSDFATILQSGGIQLLDLQTLTALPQRRIDHPLGIEPHGALYKIKRRNDCAEPRSGHFVLLRSCDKEIAKTLRDVPRSSGRNREICQRA